MSDFTDFLSQSDLQELPTAGGHFTWMGVRSRGRVWKKLDRVLFNNHWIHQFPGTTVELLSRATSDHSPLLYKCSDPVSKPSSFKFQDMWIKHPDFLRVVSDSWGLPQEGYGMYKFMCKLRRLKVTLRAWNKSFFGNIFDKVRSLEDHVKQMEVLYDSSRDDAALLNLNRAQAELLQALTLEEDFWRQKARVRWLQEGDRNTKFFHSSVIAKRARLRISKLKDDNGMWVENQEKLRLQASSFFKAQLTEEAPFLDEAGTRQILEHIPVLVDDADNERLLRPVSLDEVKAAVFHLDPSSAAGSDGFHGRFYQSC